MAQRIVWDEYETALLIDTFWQIEKTPNRKQELIKGLSDALRQKAVNSGLTIDEKFRNVNGITMQLSPIAHAFFPERPSLTSSVMFNSMVELYKTDREVFNKTLAIAKNNETNGIIVGPFTSRIISELILARIDKMLTEKGLMFKRYVDDYKFFFRSEAQAHETMPIIEKVLNEFNLTLNTSKTEIQKYPYEVLSDIKEKYNKALEREGVFGVLNAASQLHLSGEKGAYKYALKYLRGRALPDKEDLQIVIPTLVNIMLIDPKYGRYVTDYLKNNIEDINSSTLSTVFNAELEKSLEGELQQESLLFIQLIRDLNLEMSGKNLLDVIRSDNDFAIIIALDLWKNRKRSIVRTKSEAHEINVAIDYLLTELKGERLTGARWFLLYEMKVNRLVEDDMIPEIEMDEFFRKLYSLGVSFYRSVLKSE